MRPRAWLSLCILLVAGCNGIEVSEGLRDARYERDRNSDGLVDVWGFDIDRDGALDYMEFDDDRDGRVDRQCYNRDGTWETRHRKGGRAGQGRPMIVFCIDGVPARMVREMKAEGYFRHFYGPASVHSLFPSVTNESFTALWKTADVNGYEEVYYDRGEKTLKGSTWSYLRKTANKGNSYHRVFDFERSRFNEILINFAPATGFWEIDDCFSDPGLQKFVGRVEADHPFPEVYISYCIASDFLAHLSGEELLREWLREFDARLRQLIYRMGDRARIIVTSDHGNSLVRSRPLSLEDHLEAEGYRLADTITAPKDVVAPAFGLVGFAGVFCRPEETAELSKVLSRLEGIELAAHRVDESVVRVCGSNGTVAELERRGDVFRYRPIHGDPLGYEPVVEQLKERGLLRRDGFAHRDDWFAFTAEHHFPDALERLHHGFDGRVRHPANILVSCADGYVWGSTLFAAFSDSGGTHGSLRGTSTRAVFLDTDHRPPAHLRIGDVLAYLRRSGAPDDNRLDPRDRYVDSEKQHAWVAPHSGICGCQPRTGALPTRAPLFPAVIGGPLGMGSLNPYQEGRRTEAILPRRKAWEEQLIPG